MNSHFLVSCLFSALLGGLPLVAQEKPKDKSKEKPRETETTKKTEPATDAAELAQARKALAGSLPQVAVVKLRRWLATGKASKEARAEGRILLAEALARAEDWSALLEETEGVSVGSNPDLAFWRATGLQALGRFHEAEKLLAQMPPAPWPLADEATMNHAAVLATLGDPAKAVERLNPLLEAGRPLSSKATLWAAEFQLQLGSPQVALELVQKLKPVPPSLQAAMDFLTARADGLAGKTKEALVSLEQLANRTTGVSRELSHAAVLLQARLLRQSGENSAAVRTLATWIPRHASSPFLNEIFREFIAGNVPPDPEMGALLQAWRGGQDPRLAAEATHALMAAMEAESQSEAVLTLADEFVKKFPNDPLIPSVRMRQARLLISLDRQQQVGPILEELKRRSDAPEVVAWACHLQAKAHYGLEDFKVASGLFAAAATAADADSIKAVSAYNAALAALGNGQGAETMALLGNLPAAVAAPWQAELQLERGLYGASRGQPEARELLAVFLENRKDHPRAFDAALALAEMSLTTAKTTPEVLRLQVATALSLAKTGRQGEQARLIDIFAEDAMGNSEEFARKAEEFLTAHPESPQRDTLLMRLAESYFNRQQFTLAKAKFLQIVDADTPSAYEEAALFWAGKAALRSMAKGCQEEALKLWDRVAQGKGPLRFKARAEQGRLDQTRDPAAALQIFDELLKTSDPGPDYETRFAVLCMKGETLLATEPGDPAKMTEALQCFDAVVNATQASVPWKQQALVRKGTCLETLARGAEALEAYNEAMNLAQNASDNPDSAELLWFFRAGEKAIRMLETQTPGNWKGAIAIADRLAAATGPQAQAAKEKASRLRAEHFIWDEEP